MTTVARRPVEKRKAFAAGWRTIAKAKTTHPWATAFIPIKGGIWCFEDEEEAHAFAPGLVRAEDSPPEPPLWARKPKKRR